MKQVLLLVFAAVALCLSSCAIPPSIGQQTLEQQQKAQEAQNSEKFAHGLQQ
jgi:starvation-inducible outer membrane lipoprotein